MERNSSNRSPWKTRWLDNQNLTSKVNCKEDPGDRSCKTRSNRCCRQVCLQVSLCNSSFPELRASQERTFLYEVGNEEGKIRAADVFPPILDKEMTGKGGLVNNECPLHVPAPSVRLEKLPLSTTAAFPLLFSLHIRVLRRLPSKSSSANFE